MNLFKVSFFSTLVVIFLSTNLSSQLSPKKVELLEKQVVRIINIQNTRNDENNRIMGIGTGFFINSSGFIITNAHVVDDYYRVDIYLGDDENTERVEAKVEKISYDLDIALLKIDFKGLPSGLKIRSIPVKKGTSVYSSGFPYSSDKANQKFLFTSTLTNGMVSTVMTTKWQASPIDRQVVQHTSPINSGNSGGPLLDNCGNVAGVNTLKILEEGVDGVFLAISSLELIKFLEQTNVKFSKVKSECGDGNIFSTKSRFSDSSFIIWVVAIIFMIICAVGIFISNQKQPIGRVSKLNINLKKDENSYFLSGFKKDGLPIRIRLMEKDLERKYGIQIGRAGDFSDETIKSAEISRVHARIYKNQNGITIEDLGSSNGIYINNKKINYFTPCLISLNDKLVFGDVELVLTS